MDNLNQAIGGLLSQERFYAEFLQQMARNESKSLPAAAGVCFNEVLNRFELTVNPDLFNPLPLSERTAIVKHEALHVIMMHIARCDWKKLSANNRKAYNIAMDVAINQYIKGLPDWTWTLEKFRETYAKDEQVIEAEKPFEYYLSFMNDPSGEGEGEGDGEGSGQSPDTHEGFGKTSSEEVVKEAIEQAVKRAAKRCEELGAGNLPGEIVEVIKAMQSIRSWKSELRRFTTKALSVFSEDTRMRRNRRQREGAPLLRGNKLKETRRIAFIIDTSGSMDSALLAQVAGEMNRIQTESHADIVVIECDTQVNNVSTFNRKAVSELKLHGRGGTLFKPAFDYVKANFPDIDGLVYATDGECFEHDLEKPKFFVLWMLPDTQHTVPFQWGIKAFIQR